METSTSEVKSIKLLLCSAVLLFFLRPHQEILELTYLFQTFVVVVVVVVVVSWVDMENQWKDEIPVPRPV